jgi:hypothetical protein
MRQRMLMAMGLPLSVSCGGAGPGPAGSGTAGPGPVDTPAAGGPATPGPGGDTTTGGGVEAVAPDPAVVAQSGPPSAASCAPDQLFETVCGAVASPSERAPCGPTGDHLTSYGQSRLSVTRGSYGAHDATFRRFVFDATATAQYQRSLPDYLDQARSNYCCYSQCTPLRVGAAAAAPVPRGHHLETRCIPPPPAGTAMPAPGEAMCPAAVELDGAMRPFHGGHCCYSIVLADPPPQEEPRHYRGRAARVAGQVRMAGVAPQSPWAAGWAPEVASLPAALRRRLAAAWLADARMEHASIAAFSRLSLQLMALGAPPRLLAAVHAAALDEVTHAQITFALASACAGTALGPAAFADAAEMRAVGGLAELARETLLDGCIGETVAACEAGEAARCASDPVVAAALRRIAADETRHAELAWAILAWCVDAGGPRLAALVQAEVQAVAGELAAEPLEPCAGCADAGLAAHGVLCQHARDRLRSRVIQEVVVPCAGALLADRQMAAAAPRAG